MVSAGFFHTLALKRDGTLWTWGWNLHGQLGLGAIARRGIPTQVGSASDWTAVSCAANSSLALKRDGTLWAWGRNEDGQLGLGKVSDDVATPVRTGSDSDWEVVSSGYHHSLGVRRDGTLWAWGDNSAGELGLGNISSGVASPTQVGSADDWASAFGGRSCSLALKRDGTLWAWGDNSAGELGLGDTRGRLVPAQVGGTDSWVKVVFGLWRTLGFERDGTLWIWGHNRAT